VKVINYFHAKAQALHARVLQARDLFGKIERHLLNMHAMIFTALAARLALASGAIVGGRDSRRLRAKRASPQRV
jgi:hypothetical protein